MRLISYIRLIVKTEHGNTKLGTKNMKINMSKIELNIKSPNEELTKQANKGGGWLKKCLV